MFRVAAAAGFRGRRQRAPLVCCGRVSGTAAARTARGGSAPGGRPRGEAVERGGDRVRLQGRRRGTAAARTARVGSAPAGRRINHPNQKQKQKNPLGSGETDEVWSCSYLIEWTDATAAAAAGGGSGEENSRSGSEGVCASVGVCCCVFRRRLELRQPEGGAARAAAAPAGSAAWSISGVWHTMAMQRGGMGLGRP